MPTPQAKFTNRGLAMTFIAPIGGVVFGGVYLIADLLVIAANTAAAGDRVAAYTAGVFDVRVKRTGEAWSQGEKLYWDASAEEFTTTSSGNTLAGSAAEAAESSATRGYLLLNAFGSQFGSGGGAGTPSAPDTSIQFNDSGAFAGSADFTWSGSQLAVFPDDSSLDAYIQQYWVTPRLFLSSLGRGTGIGVEAQRTTTTVAPGVADNPIKVRGIGSVTLGSGETVGVDTASFLAQALRSTDGGLNTVDNQVVSVSAYTGMLSGAGNGGKLYSFWAGAPDLNSNVPAVVYSFYSRSLEGAVSFGAPSYYAWFDSTGVFRIREDMTFNSVGQAIASLYNPQFTKYTPGAANFERIILGQWNSNVAEIGTEVGAGGGNVLRKLRLIGAGLLLDSTILPTSNPGPGQLWNDANTVKVGT